ncbi:MAG TPA: sugar ABC transporter ATP-binding protein [Clostridiaceae bacterium]|nr:sugar ABC transporter ATP-binding protein [Clostridiaceae bacterium]
MEGENVQNKNSPYLKMRGITKAFPGVLALDRVDFDLELGKVVALVGENGAGKSTLMKILSGVYKTDAGEIFIDNKKVEITDPLASQNLGISIIYQELNLLQNLNIAENIFIGKEIKKHIFVDKEKMHEESQKLLNEVGLNVSTKTLVRDLSTAQKQMVEVAKALSFNSKIIIMDEPTSSLTDTETAILFNIIRKLKSKNVAIVFISHRMNEIFEIADEVVVMRDGKIVGKLDRHEMSESTIINLMVGREIEDIFSKLPADIGEPVLEVKNLSTKDFLKDISFTLRKGEILGFAGLVGAGRSEVMRAIFGIDKKETGEIFIHGKKVNIESTEDALKHGIGFIPEDRKEQGLVLGMNVRENITLAALKALSKFNFIDNKKEEGIAKEYIDKLSIKTPSEEQIVENLSGGNQQKVVIGKWMATNPEILILDEPTRGIDVGAKKEIHILMSKLAQQGVGIILISSELPEILGMSDRIIVMHEGRIKGELSREEASQEKIMKIAISNNS